MRKLGSLIFSLLLALAVGGAAQLAVGGAAQAAPPSCDSDGDGFDADNGRCGGDDCDDSDPNVFPGAEELCDGVDNDCDGTVDEGCDDGSGDTSSLPSDTAACGDSITMGFAADCTCNTSFGCQLCLLGGDQPEHSWFDGDDSDVYSVHDRYLELDSNISATKDPAESGSEMRGGSNNFSAQADQVLSLSPVPDHVEVLLGGNDICNRDCTDSSNCDDPLYTDAEWTEAVRAGLDKLVAGVPEGSTVYLMGVPRVQDLRAAGLEKQKNNDDVDCEAIWSDQDICTIATQGSDLNGESIDTRLSAIDSRQQRYNEILRDEAEAYNTNSDGQNPRGIEVVADYVDETTDSVGTFQFTAEDIDGGDCFHPSLRGQNTTADLSWLNNPDR